jgi:hypothetical protein
LLSGDKVLLASGEESEIDSIESEILDEPVKVYNFEVEDFHTYFVGESAVLVHNNCAMPAPDGSKAPKDLTPDGAGRSGALNQAKKDLGIPTSSSPDSVLPNVDKRGIVQPGKAYQYGDIIIRDDVAGHIFPDGGSLSRHFNTPDGGHYFY